MAALRLAEETKKEAHPKEAPKEAAPKEPKEKKEKGGDKGGDKGGSPKVSYAQMAKAGPTSPVKGPKPAAD
jgi:hypothetical protein